MGWLWRSECDATAAAGASQTQPQPPRVWAYSRAQRGRGMASSRDIVNSTRMQAGQEFMHRGTIKLWIGRRQRKKESVAASQLELRHVEDRMIRHRQSVQGKHAQYG